MAKRSMGVMEMFVLVGEKELFMRLGGPGKAQITMRCHAQYSEADAVRRSSNLHAAIEPIHQVPQWDGC